VTEPAKTLLGFDFGTKRIGVAVGQSLTRSASPLTTLTSVHHKPDWNAIGRLIDEWRPDALVVGLPLNADDSANDVSRAAQRFGNQLQGRYNLPVYTVNERLSSQEAERILDERGGHYNKADIDKLAATLILESWFATHAD
jgi:putative Holliday junction resolvase